MVGVSVGMDVTVGVNVSVGRSVEVDVRVGSGVEVDGRAGGGVAVSVGGGGVAVSRIEVPAGAHAAEESMSIKGSNRHIFRMLKL